MKLISFLQLLLAFFSYGFSLILASDIFSLSKNKAGVEIA